VHCREKSDVSDHSSTTTFIFAPIAEARTSNVPIEGHASFGRFPPLNMTSHRYDPKRHIRAWFLVFGTICVKIRPEVTSVGESDTKNNRKTKLYVSRICPDAPLRPTCTKFGLRVRVVDVNNCAKFHRNRLTGLNSGSVKFWPLPQKCDVAVTTVSK